MDKDALNKIANEAVDLWMKEEFEKAEPLFRQTLPFVDDNHFVLQIISFAMVNWKRRWKRYNHHWTSTARKESH